MQNESGPPILNSSTSWWVTPGNCCVRGGCSYFPREFQLCETPPTLNSTTSCEVTLGNREYQLCETNLDRQNKLEHLLKGHSAELWDPRLGWTSLAEFSSNFDVPCSNVALIQIWGVQAWHAPAFAPQLGAGQPSLANSALNSIPAFQKLL